MCFITLIVASIGLALYYLGVLDRPKFRVIESVFGKRRSGQKKQVYALVVTAKDEAYIDENFCTVLKALKKSIESLVISNSEIEAEDDTSTQEKTPDETLTLATSYLFSEQEGTSPSIVNKEVPHQEPRDEDDVIGICMFLQDPATAECIESSVGLLVEAPSQEHANEVAKTLKLDIAIKGEKDVPSLDDTECSKETEDEAESSDSTQRVFLQQKDTKHDSESSFFQVHAVSLGNGPVLRGRIPLRSRFVVYTARYLHWGRAYSKYLDMTVGRERKRQPEQDCAVACEVYVNGSKNPAIGSYFVDYFYLLDSRDSKALRDQMKVAYP